MLVVAEHVGRRGLRRCCCRIGLTIGQVTLHEIIKRAVEYLAELQQLVHLGIRPL